VLSSGQKLTFGQLATITFEVVLFHMYSWLTALLPLFKCILEVLFCDSVQHCLKFCLDRLNCFKMVAIQLGKQRKVVGEQVWRVGWVGMGVIWFLVQKFPGQKGSVKWCAVMMQQPVLLSPKFWAESLHIFMQSP
jgi:hypothetical protein